MVQQTQNTCYYYRDATVESDSSSIASSTTGARVGTTTEDITPASTSTISSHTGNSSCWDRLALRWISTH